MSELEVPFEANMAPAPGSILEITRRISSGVHHSTNLLMHTSLADPLDLAPEGILTMVCHTSQLR